VPIVKGFVGFCRTLWFLGGLGVAGRIRLGGLSEIKKKGWRSNP